MGSAPDRDRPPGSTGGTPELARAEVVMAGAAPRGWTLIGPAWQPGDRRWRMQAFPPDADEPAFVTSAETDLECVEAMTWALRSLAR